MLRAAARLRQGEVAPGPALANAEKPCRERPDARLHPGRQKARLTEDRAPDMRMAPLPGRCRHGLQNRLAPAGQLRASYAITHAQHFQPRNVVSARARLLLQATYEIELAAWLSANIGGERIRRAAGRFCNSPRHAGSSSVIPAEMTLLAPRLRTWRRRPSDLEVLGVARLDVVGLLLDGGGIVLHQLDLGGLRPALRRSGLLRANARAAAVAEAQHRAKCDAHDNPQGRARGDDEASAHLEPSSRGQGARQQRSPRRLGRRWPPCRR